MANVREISAHFDTAWKVLRERWQTTSDGWQDGAKKTFEDDYWNPLEIQIHATQTEMDRLTQIIERARSNVK